MQKNKGFGQTVIGLDIEEDAIKMVQLSQGPKGISAVKVGSAEIASALTPTLSRPRNDVTDTSPTAENDSSLAMTKGTTDDSIIAAIKKLFAENKFKKAPVCLNIPESESCVRIVTVPFMQDEELQEAVKYVAKRHIAYPLEEIVLAFSVLGEVVEEEVKKLKIIFIGVQKGIFQRYISLAQKAELKPAYVGTNCFALGNLLAFCGINSDNTVVMLNTGFTNSSIAFLKNNQIAFTRSVPCGLGSSDVDTIDKLTPELRLSLNHYSQISHGETVGKIILSGASSAIKELPNSILEKLGLPAEVIQAPESLISNPQLSQYNISEQFSSYAIAFGLALESGANPNLILSQEKTAKKTFFSGQKTLQKITAGFIAAGVLPFLALNGSNLHYQKQIKISLSRLNRLEDKNIELLSIKRNIIKQKARKELFENIANSQAPFLEILAGISTTIEPEKIFIRSMDIDSSAKGEPKLGLQGEIVNSPDKTASEALTDFISRLETIKYFKKITPNTRETRGLEREKRFLSFSVECDIVK